MIAASSSRGMRGNRPSPTSNPAGSKLSRAARRRAKRHDSPERLSAVLAAYTARFNRAERATGGWITIADFLDIIGFPEADKTRYASACGRKVAETYRDAHMADPDKGGLAMAHGRMFKAMRYNDLQDLIDGCLAYKRTRPYVQAVERAVFDAVQALINAADTAAGTGLAAAR